MIANLNEDMSKIKAKVLKIVEKEDTSEIMLYCDCKGNKKYKLNDDMNLNEYNGTLIYVELNDEKKSINRNRNKNKNGIKENEKRLILRELFGKNINDTIVACGVDGAIVIQIKHVLLNYSNNAVIVEHKNFKTAVSGGKICILRNFDNSNKQLQEEISSAREMVQLEINVLNKYKNENGNGNGIGVYIHAPNLKILIQLCQIMNGLFIKYNGFKVGSITRKDIDKTKKTLQLGRLIIFSIGEILDYEKDFENNVEIVHDNDIPSLMKKFKSTFMRGIIFPVSMKIVSQNEEHKCSDENENAIPIVVDIEKGRLRNGIPIVLKRYDDKGVGRPIFLGQVQSIILNNQPVSEAKSGDRVVIMINGQNHVVEIGQLPNFACNETIVSQIIKGNRDILCTHYAKELSDDDKKHLDQLSKYFQISK